MIVEAPENLQGAKDYLEKNVNPTLTRGLTALAKVRRSLWFLMVQELSIHSLRKWGQLIPMACFISVHAYQGQARGPRQMAGGLA